MCIYSFVAFSLGIQIAEKEKVSTFTYLYTAHPDKHMHALGVEDKQVKDLIQSMDYELERLCKTVHNLNLDTSVVITADHGHVTVEPEFIVKLQPELLECLEYANIGVHGRVSVSFTSIYKIKYLNNLTSITI